MLVEGVWKEEAPVVEAMGLNVLAEGAQLVVEVVLSVGAQGEVGLAEGVQVEVLVEDALGELVLEEAQVEVLVEDAWDVGALAVEALGDVVLAERAQVEVWVLVEDAWGVQIFAAEALGEVVLAGEAQVEVLENA